MKRLYEIFRLEFVSIVRSKTLALLALAAVGWTLAMPWVMKGDGTEEGARELYVHYSVGGVFALLVVALVASATGALARERAAKRLQLTMVRPVRYSAIALGKVGAHVAAGAVVLALAFLTMNLRVDSSRPCSHALSPVLPSPQEEAKTMYEEYMKSPDTPDAVKKAGKSVVMRLLVQRAVDHYQTLPTNEVCDWTFDLSAFRARPADCSVRMRFTNQFDMRQDVLGVFRLEGLSGSVSNITQSILRVPLGRLEEPGAAAKLTFANNGKTALMLRPRKDLELLVRGDAFWANSIRAYLEMVAALAAVVAFGVFLGAGLGRPVALFVALVTLLVGEMSPSVVDQYPDEIGANFLDRAGLEISRAAAEITKPISSLSPVEALAQDDCVEWGEVLRILAADLVGVPLFLVLLSAFVMPRKQEDA